MLVDKAEQSLVKFAIALMITVLSGCASMQGGLGSKPAAVASEPVSSWRWVSDLGGEPLEALVQEAWRANPDMAAAMASLEKARAQAVMAGAALYPSASLEFSGSRSRTLSVIGRNQRTLLGLTADVSWAPDLWGRIRNQQQAGLEDAAAAVADARGVRLLLAADAVKAWLRAREAALQWHLSQQRAESFAATLQVISERYEAGLAEALDVYLARENLATARAAAVAAQRRQDAGLRVLESLLGRYPAAAVAVSGAQGKLPGSISAGLDARVLLRRPDIQAWQHRLSAANARLADALKNRFATLSLTGRVGTQSTALSDLLDWDNLVWSLLGNLVQPLFQGGRLRAEQLLARAQNREILANYAKTVLQALRDVQTTLAAEPLLNRQLAFQEKAADTADRAAELALSNYRAGLIEIDTLLNTQRRAFSARSALLTTRLDRLLNRVDLHLAIGGDFIGKAETHRSPGEQRSND